MSREMKFRAWIETERRHYNVEVIDWVTGGVCCSEDTEFAFADVILEQYLGRNDTTRNEEFPDGKPIYVGDIVKFADHSYLAEVKYYPEFAAFLFDSHTEDTRNNPMTGMCWVDDFEVVGNIHQNPELLQGNK